MIRKQTNRFKHSLKRLAKRHYPIELIGKVVDAIEAQDKRLLKKANDHPLKNNWQGYRAFHPGRLAKGNHQVLDNWIVIYTVNDEEVIVLTLIDTGSHDIL
ncbi:hypothetical protein YK48G_19480 [Lentilactobacillus fungorum]|uniref:Type II toxin-antitoxin system YafQ family toxin n=1 Tax=Lentilactobacillus fungorum TaxID=2201250 RepID=A0ABQ3W033_9LACO|nr:type II toxin-antitoxin system YafQ family toxin [Lentilactobacillus fungorum]GHP14523.1 hypothetical protein YK48G_19480 [Lentilactobacillus fungorum]